MRTPKLTCTPETDTVHSAVCDAVCDVLGIDRMEINSARRWQDVSMARHLVRYILRIHHGWSYRLIGMYTVGGHHTTVLHSVRSMRATLDTSGLWRAYYAETMRRANAVNN